MSSENRLVEYFLVAGVDSSSNGSRKGKESEGANSASLTQPASPLAAAITKGEDGK